MDQQRDQPDRRQTLPQRGSRQVAAKAHPLQQLAVQGLPSCGAGGAKGVHQR